MFFRKTPDPERFLVIGLGNPGKKYRYTRHNVGFLVLDFIADENRIRVTRSRFSALTGEGKIDGVSVTLIKPLTYMNLSGQAAAAAASYYRLGPDRIVVICDDVNLNPGILRIRAEGSSGGQKGLRSIEDMLDSRDYIRIRVGVGEKVGEDLAEHVLSAPSSADREAIVSRFRDVGEAVGMIINGRLAEAQSRFNG